MQHWARWFRASPEHQLAVPWEADFRLSAAERRIIGSSMAQFEKGESSDGRHLMDKALLATSRQADQSYIEALRHFILEENRHSALLGRFMDQQELPRIERHWLDDVFRLVRKPGSLEHAIRILVMAEVIAVPYYTALRAATCSPVLQAICDQILRDERLHLQFQGETLGALALEHRPLAQRLHRWQNRRLLDLACAFVWMPHRRVLRCGGYSPLSFRRACHEIWAEVEALIAGDDRYLTGIPWLQFEAIAEPVAKKKPRLVAQSQPAPVLLRSKGPAL